MIPRIQKRTPEFVRLSRLYAARRVAPSSPLEAYPTLDALLAALFGRAQADGDARRRLLCTVIAEYQATPGPVGPAVVLHAFRGMLVCLSRSLRGVDDHEEADALVVAGLLEALVRVRPGRDPDRIGMYVRQETRRAVFAALRREARAREDRKIDEDEAYAGESGADEPGADDSCADDARDVGDDAGSNDLPYDPLARERALARREPDAFADPESLVPLEDRMLFISPTVDGIADETLRAAHAVRGGLRRLTNHLFERASPQERERVYRVLLRRAELLLTTPR